MENATCSTCFEMLEKGLKFWKLFFSLCQGELVVQFILLCAKIEIE